MLMWTRRIATFVGVSLLAAGGMFAFSYLAICEFARAVE